MFVHTANGHMILLLYAWGVLGPSPPPSLGPSRQTGRIATAVIVTRRVLRQGDITDLDILVGPLVEQLDAANLGDDVLGQDLVTRRGGIDLDLSVIRHAGQQLRFLEGISCCRRLMSWESVVGRRKLAMWWAEFEFRTGRFFGAVQRQPASQLAPPLQSPLVGSFSAKNKQFS